MELLKQWFIGLVTCFLLASVSRAQVVNIEQARIKTDTSAWAGHIQSTFFSQQNQNRLLSASLRGTVQHKTKNKKHLYLALLDGNFSASNAVQYSNAAMIHLRYNYKLFSLLKWEVFSQLQQNKVLGLDRRALLGTGPRLKLLDSEHWRSYWGVLGMLEQERLKGASQLDYFMRASSYFTITITQSERWSFASTTYYQPLFADFHDFRIAGQHTFSLAIAKHWAMRAELTHTWDSKPPTGVVKSTVLTSMGIGIDL